MTTLIQIFKNLLGKHMGEKSLLKTKLNAFLLIKIKLKFKKFKKHSKRFTNQRRN